MLSNVIMVIGIIRFMKKQFGFFFKFMVIVRYDVLFFMFDVMDEDINVYLMFFE